MFDRRSGKGWPTPLQLTSKNVELGQMRHSRRRSLAIERPLGLALGLMLPGCPTGAELDTPYPEYAAEPGGITGGGPVTSSTTSGEVICDDAGVNALALNAWCSGSSCHGTEAAQGKAPVWLFSPTRSTDLLNLPAVTGGCSTELLVNTANPEASLIITSIRSTAPAPCEVAMPPNFPINVPEEQACIEEWVLNLAANGGG